MHLIQRASIRCGMADFAQWMGDDPHCLLGQAVKQLDPRRRGPPFESEGEFAQIVVELLDTDCALMSAQQPALEQ